MRKMNEKVWMLNARRLRARRGRGVGQLEEEVARVRGDTKEARRVEENFERFRA